MSPEVSLGVPYNEKTDVYSFGILLWYMATGKTPFDGWDVKDLFRRVTRGGERPLCDVQWPSAFSNLLSECWDELPSRRPNFLYIFSCLEQMVADASNVKKKVCDTSCTCVQENDGGTINDSTHSIDFNVEYQAERKEAVAGEETHVSDPWNNGSDAVDIEAENFSDANHTHTQPPHRGRNRIERFESSWF